MSVKRLNGSVLKALSGSRFIISLVVLCASLLAVFMIMLAFRNRFTGAIEQTTLENNNQAVTHLADNLENYLRDMLSLAENVTDTLDDNPGDWGHSILLTTKLRTDIEAVMVLDRSGNPMPAGQSLKLKPNVNIYRQDWCDIYNLQKSGHYFSMPHVQNLFHGKYEWVVSLVYLTSWRDEKDVKQNGSILVDINMDSFKDMCSKATMGSERLVYITDRYGNIVYHPLQNLIYLGLKSGNTAYYVGASDSNGIIYQDGKRYAYSVSILPSTGWRVVGVDYLKDIVNFDANMQHDLITIILIIILISLAVAMISSYYVTRPIHSLTSTVQATKDGNFDIQMDLNQYRVPYEIRELAYSFDNMLRRIHGLVAQIKEEQQLLRKSEIKALQAQINPHFLYNTLDSIVWLAEARDYKGITVMTTSLASLFRLSISGGKEYITVADELKHAQSYLTIQKIRYKDKFDYEMLIESGTMECKVIRILLQPLIENAIYHGVGKLVDKGNITIRARIEGECLILEVEDDGCGMSEETLQNILTGVPSTSKRHSGIGVYNVHQRIQLLFGREYGLGYQSELEAGTKVIVRLPVIRGEEGR